MNTAIISIGRGRPDDSNYLSSLDWQLFRASLDLATANYGEQTFATTGLSESMGWGQEESYTVGLLTAEVEALTRELAYLASLYAQGAIAFTYGTTILVGPATATPEVVSA